MVVCGLYWVLLLLMTWFVHLETHPYYISLDLCMCIVITI